MVLLEFWLPVKMVKVIMTYDSTVMHSRLLNRGLTPSFQEKRGFRQGDSMSLYIFILAMKYLIGP